MSEVLPYLEAQKDNVMEEDEKKDVEVPNIEGLTIEEAKEKLKKINPDIVGWIKVPGTRIEWRIIIL